MTPAEEDALRKAIRPKWAGAAQLVELYLYAFLGGWFATLVHMPASWLMGSLAAVTIAVLAGRPLFMPNWLRDIAFLQVALIMGTGFSPETIEAIAAWPLSILFLIGTVLAIAWSSYAVLRYAGGWDHATSFFSSLPGALSYVMTIAENAGTDLTRVAIVQAIRLFALVALLPLLLALGGADLTPASLEEAVVSEKVASLPLSHLLLMLGMSLLAAACAKYLKVPAHLLLAGMAVSGGFYLSGTFEAPLPDWFAIPGFVTIGALIGTRFSGISLKDLLSTGRLSLTSLAASVLVAAIASWACSTLLDFPFGQVFLAFAPGGFETMVLLSFLFDLNPAYVAGHHLVRYLGLVVLAPIVSARLVTMTGNRDRSA